MPALPESFAVLRQRDFRLLFYGHAVSVLGDRMVAVALAFAVIELGGSVSTVGLVLASGTVPLVACLLIGGVVADRTSRRAVMVSADLVRVASQGTMAALLIAGAAEVWMVALLAGVTGAATGFFNPAATGLLPTVVASEHLQQANAVRGTAMSGGEILGPVLAGVIAAAATPGWAIAVDAATFAVSAGCLLLLRVPPAAARAAASFVADLAEGWRAFSSRTWVWTLVASVAVGNMLWGAWSALGPVVADRELGGAAAWGTVLAAIGVGALGGSLMAARARPQRPLVVVALAGAVFALPLAFLAAGAPAALLALAALLSGAALALANSLWESTIQRHIPTESLSRVSAYDWFGSMAFYPVGLAIWGPLAAWIGIGSALWLAFALSLVATLGLLAVPDIRRLPASPSCSTPPATAPPSATSMRTTARRGRAPAP